MPGLSPITFSARAVDKVRQRETRVQSWFCDINLLMSYYESGEKTRAYHHTAPVNSLFAMHEALRLVVDETLEKRWDRHSGSASHLYGRLEAAGLEMVVELQHRLAPLTLVRIPDGVDDAAVRRELLQEQNIELGGGTWKNTDSGTIQFLGTFNAKFFRDQKSLTVVIIDLGKIKSHGCIAAQCLGTVSGQNIYFA